MRLKNVRHRGARATDLDKLLPWLETDYAEFGEGFWSQRRMICQAVAEGDLYVATRGGKVIGFQLGETEVRLIQVRRRHQGKGVGTILVDGVLQRAAEAGKPYCFAGALDEGFWLKQGFAEFVGDPLGGRVLMAIHVPTWRRQVATGGPQVELFGSC
jgi:GNAT superfamily N-acetyltransferase